MSFICTKSGRKHLLSQLSAGEVTPDDLSGIAYIGRYNGATRAFYSVAQHCILASQYAPSHLALEALLHDAHECLVGDCISPIKRWMSAFGFSAFGGLEKKAESLVARQYGLDTSSSTKAIIKAIDRRLLSTEKRDLLPLAVEPWPELAGIQPYDEVIVPWTPEYARQAFLIRLDMLLWYREEMEVMSA